MGVAGAMGLLLLLLLLLPPPVVLLPMAGAQADCGENEYPHQGLCCLLCEAGTFVAEHCRASHWNGKCDPCMEGTSFTAHANGLKECLLCRQCNEDQITQSPCNRTHNTKCLCKPGYSCADEDCQKCERNSPMHPNGKEISQNSTDATDTGVPSQGMIVLLVILVSGGLGFAYCFCCCCS